MTTARSSPPDLAVRLVAQVAERVRREVVLARFIGKFAVDRGLSELRDRIDPAPPSADLGGAQRDLADPVAAVADVAMATEQVAAKDETVTTDEVDVDDLALMDYDHLSSAQVVAKLGDLDLAERGLIARYEQAHRHRRTILGKLDQLGDA